MKKVLLWIPMYNCENQIVRVLKQVDSETLKYITEAIVVNNRSTDNGEKAAVDYCMENPSIPVKVLRNCENYGLGGSHKVAFSYAIENGFDYVITLHGDDQGDIHDLVPYLESGEAYEYDSFLGSRFEKESKLVNYSKFRIFGNHIFNCYISMILGKKITDLGSGLNMYKVDYLKNKFFMNFIDSLTFNVYLLMYGPYSKSKFKFFPLTWREEDQISNAKFFKQSKEIFALSQRYLWNRKELFKNSSMNQKDYKFDTIYDYSGEKK